MQQPVAGFHGSAVCSFRVKCLDAAGLEIAVRGELDLHTVTTFEVVVQECLAEGRPIVLDLLGVTFIDRAALRAIEGLPRRTRAAVTLAATSPCVDRLMRLAGPADVDGERLVG